MIQELSIKFRIFLLMAGGVLAGFPAMAQGDASVKATADARTITIGDQARVFLEVQHHPANGTVQWAALPDTFSKLEIVGKGAIDTLKNGALVTYRQRLLVTGFDSGQFFIPSFQFSVLPKNGTPYVLSTDSIPLLVQTVAVDTTKPIKPIKGIMQVQSSWLDYIWLIIGLAVFLIFLVFIVVYFLRKKRSQVPAAPVLPSETLQERALKLLGALEAEQIWQQGQVKEYYVRLTDIVRSYLEARFDMAAMELTTDELMAKARHHKDIIRVAPLLEMMLRTADLAKFAKAQPTPQEHIDTMQAAKELIQTTTPVIIDNPSTATA